MDSLMFYSTIANFYNQMFGGTTDHYVMHVLNFEIFRQLLHSVSGDNKSSSVALVVKT